MKNFNCNQYKTSNIGNFQNKKKINLSDCMPLSVLCPNAYYLFFLPFKWSIQTDYIASHYLPFFLLNRQQKYSSSVEYHSRQDISDSDQEFHEFPEKFLHNRKLKLNLHHKYTILQNHYIYVLCQQEPYLKHKTNNNCKHNLTM